MADKQLYSGVELCRTLEAGARCFRIRKYREGAYDVVFHQHVRKHRIGNDNAIALMKTLMARHRSLSDIDVLRGYLNKRGKEPSAMSIGSVHCEFPEPGVLRKYVSHRDIEVLLDEVISEDRFRK